MRGWAVKVGSAEGPRNSSLLTREMGFEIGNKGRGRLDESTLQKHSCHNNN